MTEVRIDLRSMSFESWAISSHCAVHSSLASLIVIRSIYGYSSCGRGWMLNMPLLFCKKNCYFWFGNSTNDKNTSISFLHTNCIQDLLHTNCHIVLFLQLVLLQKQCANFHSSSSFFVRRALCVNVVHWQDAQKSTLVFMNFIQSLFVVITQCDENLLGISHVV